MSVMRTAWYPSQSINDMVKAMSNAPKVPDFIKKWHTFTTADAQNGVKVYNLIMIKENISDQAIIAIVKMQNHFTSEVKGYSWKVEICVGMKDGMKLLGK